jgi:hypothetical protein
MTSGRGRETYRIDDFRVDPDFPLPSAKQDKPFVPKLKLEY